MRKLVLICIFLFLATWLTMDIIFREPIMVHREEWVGGRQLWVGKNYMEWRHQLMDIETPTKKEE